ncbi:hypothetical protein CYLTODRAFT_415992 [Cylindrobasidium torrendii FP15055 ss-10]|uniref:Uncharacterized protein n=1 Tax=Cylindrobasidium torrendii FP15055 ss-10 TaxID=1314674 RepID=A0A0D7ARK2_9AGAR|nr:hypothetical protein CYLTODRAFT_415992 [Cylindrobasidium torrendii FP15055 ss-10]
MPAANAATTSASSSMPAAATVTQTRGDWVASTTAVALTNAVALTSGAGIPVVERSTVHIALPRDERIHFHGNTLTEGLRVRDWCKDRDGRSAWSRGVRRRTLRIPPSTSQSGTGSRCLRAGSQDPVVHGSGAGTPSHTGREYIVKPVHRQYRHNLQLVINKFEIWNRVYIIWMLEEVHNISL